MGRLYYRVAESRRWMVDVLGVLFLLGGIGCLAAWWLT